MTVKEFLDQARWLDQRIGADMAEVKRLRQMLGCISSPSLEENYNATRSTEAPYARQIEKITELEDCIKEEISELVDLKAQIRKAIGSPEDPDERLILQYHYIDGMPWVQIAGMLNADVSTIRRWHKSALSHVEMPRNPIQIRKSHANQRK